MLARETSISLGVEDDRRVVQRVKLYICVRGHLITCMWRETYVDGETTDRYRDGDAS